MERTGKTSPEITSASSRTAGWGVPWDVVRAKNGVGRVAGNDPFAVGVHRFTACRGSAHGGHVSARVSARVAMVWTTPDGRPWRRSSRVRTLRHACGARRRRTLCRLEPSGATGDPDVKLGPSKGGVRAGTVTAFAWSSSTPVSD